MAFENLSGTAKGTRTERNFKRTGLEVVDLGVELFKMTKSSFRYFKTSPEIILLTVMMWAHNVNSYVCFRFAVEQGWGGGAPWLIQT